MTTHQIWGHNSLMTDGDWWWWYGDTKLSFFRWTSFSLTPDMLLSFHEHRRVCFSNRRGRWPRYIYLFMYIYMNIMSVASSCDWPDQPTYLKIVALCELAMYEVAKLQLRTQTWDNWFGLLVSSTLWYWDIFVFIYIENSLNFHLPTPSYETCLVLTTCVIKLSITQKKTQQWHWHR